MIFLWFLIPVGLYLIDLILYWTWAPICFRIGIPFVRKKYRIPTPMDKQRLIERLDSMFAGSWWEQGREFHQISENEIAFRGAYSIFNRSRLPSGLILFIPERETVIVTIYLDLDILLILAFFPLVLYFVTSNLFSVLSYYWLIACFGVVMVIILWAGLIAFFLRQGECKFATRVGRLIHSSVRAEQETIHNPEVSTVNARQHNG